MVVARLMSAFAAASLLAAASAASANNPVITPSVSIKNPITTPTTTLPASAIVEIGCFQTPGPSFEDHGPYIFQTEGNCQLVCLQLGKNVLAMSDGTDCWCGDTIPAKAYQVDNSTCDTTCAGDKEKHCGGPGALWVALTGMTRNRVDYDPNPSSSSTQSSASSTPQPVATISPPKQEGKKGGSNTVAIAVGVVVGIVAVFALGFGVWFVLRRRSQRQAEEDYRRNAANVNQFVNGGKLHTSNSSMNDSRLDPSFLDRRQSNGSIADNEDYSRRILKVTNA